MAINGNCLSKEHGAYHYFDKDNLPSRIVYKHRNAIDKWLRIKPGVF